MRKLMILALGGAVAAYVKRSRNGQADEPASAPTAHAPSPAGAPPVDTTADTVETDAVIPDTSADDPDTVTADVEPEMRPVVEGSGDAAETSEQTEEQGR